MAVTEHLGISGLPIRKLSTVVYKDVRSLPLTRFIQKTNVCELVASVGLWAIIYDETMIDAVGPLNFSSV